MRSIHSHYPCRSLGVCAFIEWMRIRQCNSCGPVTRRSPQRPLKRPAYGFTNVSKRLCVQAVVQQLESRRAVRRFGAYTGEVSERVTCCPVAMSGLSGRKQQTLQTSYAAVITAWVVSIYTNQGRQAKPTAKRTKTFVEQSGCGCAMAEVTTSGARDNRRGRVGLCAPMNREPYSCALEQCVVYLPIVVAHIIAGPCRARPRRTIFARPGDLWDALYLHRSLDGIVVTTLIYSRNSRLNDRHLCLQQG